MFPQRLDGGERSDIFAIMTEKLQQDRADGKAAPAGTSKQEPSPAAQRALAEAEVRRAAIDRKSTERPKELNGRGGPDPARYGDWEVKGIASDF
jgi:hypothetical protein